VDVFEQFPELEGAVKKVKVVREKELTFYVVRPNVKQECYFEKLALQAGKSTTEEMKHWTVLNLVAKNSEGELMFPIKTRDEAKKKFKKRPHVLNAMFEGCCEVMNESKPTEGALEDLGEQSEAQASI
jgi:hypothetical protein